jgi:hypothetical protein
MIYKIILLFSFIFIFNTNAYAYLDPGLGSIILQGLIALIAATSLTIKIYWQKIKNFLKKIKKNKTLDK